MDRWHDRHESIIDICEYHRIAENAETYPSAHRTTHKWTNFPVWRTAEQNLFRANMSLFCYSEVTRWLDDYIAQKCKEHVYRRACEHMQVAKIKRDIWSLTCDLPWFVDVQEAIPAASSTAKPQAEEAALAKGCLGEENQSGLEQLDIVGLQIELRWTCDPIIMEHMEHGCDRVIGDESRCVQICVKWALKSYCKTFKFGSTVASTLASFRQRWLPGWHTLWSASCRRLLGDEWAMFKTPPISVGRYGRVSFSWMGKLDQQTSRPPWICLRLKLHCWDVFAHDATVSFDKPTFGLFFGRWILGKLYSYFVSWWRLQMLWRTLEGFFNKNPKTCEQSIDKQ